jgi:hypothetical protein
MVGKSASTLRRLLILQILRSNVDRAEPAKNTFEVKDGDER